VDIYRYYSYIASWHGQRQFYITTFLYDIYYITFPTCTVVTAVKVMRKYYGWFSVWFEPSFQIAFRFRSYHTEAVKSDHHLRHLCSSAANLSSWNTSTSAVRIFLKLYNVNFHYSMSICSSLGYTGTLRKDPGTFSISRKGEILLYSRASSIVVLAVNELSTISTIIAVSRKQRDITLHCSMTERKSFVGTRRKLRGCFEEGVCYNYSCVQYLRNIKKGYALQTVHNLIIV
jgi:hypothetical protein